MSPIQKKSCVVDESNAGRVDRVVQSLTGMSRRQVIGLLDHGGATVNGQPASQSHLRVVPGDVVAVRFDPGTGYHPAERPWTDPAFRMVFEDEHILVVDKAAWCLTVPTESEATHGKTLVDRVTDYMNRGQRGPRAYIIHRLDRGTSGLLVFARKATVGRTIKDQFAAHKPQREYLALVAGSMEKDEGTFRSFLTTAPNLTRYSTDDEEEGELAVTHWTVERRLPGMTLVRCKLETGKRNQIRVHFAEAGHPVLGDQRYEPAAARSPAWAGKRLALHAAVLGFEHPVTFKPVLFESPIPDEFVKAMRLAKTMPARTMARPAGPIASAKRADEAADEKTAPQGRGPKRAGPAGRPDRASAPGRPPRRAGHSPKPGNKPTPAPRHRGKSDRRER